MVAQAFVGSVALEAQTFTAGRDGELDRVEVKGFRSANPGLLTMRITAVDQNGLPTGPALGGGSADTSALPAYTGDLTAGGWLSLPLVAEHRQHLSGEAGSSG